MEVYPFLDINVICFQMLLEKAYFFLHVTVCKYNIMQDKLLLNWFYYYFTP